VIDQPAMHEPLYVTELPTTSEEAMIIDEDIVNTGVPELCYHEEDSDSESGDSLEEEEQVLGEFEEELEEIQRALEDSDGSRPCTNICILVVVAS
jgi:hypothetical protein